MPRTRGPSCSDENWTTLINTFEGEGCDIVTDTPIHDVDSPNCLKMYQPPVKTKPQPCIPRTRPDNCGGREWQNLVNHWDGPQCPPLELPQLGRARPAYLSVAGHPLCLLTFTAGSHKEKCLPKNKLQLCSNVAWKKLKKVFKGAGCPSAPRLIGRTGPPLYLSVEGHEKCLTGRTPVGQALIKCMPVEKPEDCSQKAWTTLKSLQSVITCPQERQGLLGVGAPPYLQIPKWDLCTSSYQPKEATHTEHCLPSNKPSGCPISSWKSIKEVWTGIGCPRSDYKLVGGTSSLPPAYLSIADFKDCLSTYAASDSHEEFCLPNGPPPRCTEGDWNKLLDVFEGVQCPIIAQVMVDEMPEFMVGGPAGLPPAYLSV